jgi:uncharacterized protein (DUF952 family)
MSQNDFIYHITTQAQWVEASRGGVYSGDTLHTEGFIHCSTRKQVVGTANRFYSGRTDLVLLEIDPGKVKPEIKVEGVPGGEQFPHLYGELETAAVVRVLAFQPDTEGIFQSF